MIQTVIFYFVFPVLSISLILGFIRLLVGPTLPDRIIATELIATTSAGIIVVSAIATHKSVLLDVASVWAIVAFLSTIGFAYYIERWGTKP
jgi:multicomponent Na+:H+ antiporter subunit F